MIYSAPGRGHPLDPALARTRPFDKALDPLTRDEEKGWIHEGDNRIVTLRVKTFQTLSNQLGAIAGSKISGVILNQLGMACGRVVMGYSREEIQLQSDLPTILDWIMKDRGWGRCVDLTWQSSGTRTTYVVKVKGSPLSHEHYSSQPSCHLLRGALSGWLEAYFDAKVLDSTETECESMGNSFCVFEITLDKPYAQGKHTTS